MVVFGLALCLLLKMVPPPTATWSAAEIARFYAENSLQIRCGACISAWTSACMVPISIVIGIQMSRLERGRPIWSVLAVVGGALMSIWFALPPLFYGVAAFTPGRSPDVTAIMHELGVLSMVSTDQYYIFLWVAMAVFPLLRHNDAAHSPFPRWYGYFNAWMALLLEAGAIVFLTRTGPFAWNGLLPFWVPLSTFGIWWAITAALLLRALNTQATEAAELEPASAAVPA